MRSRISLEGVVGNTKPAYLGTTPTLPYEYGLYLLAVGGRYNTVGDKSLRVAALKRVVSKIGKHFGIKLSILLYTLFFPPFINEYKHAKKYKCW